MAFVEAVRFGDISVQGWSQAGIETWFRVQPPGLAFDVGRGAVELTGAGDIFLSHGHLDHSLGVPFVLSHRAWQGREATRLFCPRPMAESLADLIRAAEDLENETFRYEIRPLEVGDRVDVGKDVSIEAFATDHVVPSLGYHLLRHRTRLRPELRDLDSREIARRRQAGEVVGERHTEVALSYCGDTGPAVFDLSPEIFKSPVLLIECTFFDSSRHANSIRYKHLHLDDFVERQDRFENEAIVLHHISRRHSPGALRKAVEERLQRLAERVVVFPSGEVW